MKPSKYTVMFIPDNDEESKQYVFSRRRMQGVIWGLVLIFIIGIGIGLYSLPMALEHRVLLTKYNRLTRERVEVLSLLQDLQRIKMMDRQIRETLGTDLKFSPESGSKDSIDLPPETHTLDDLGIRISYVENIPSLAPIQGYVTQRMHQSSMHQIDNHYGIDIAVKEGDPILASASGYVLFSGWTYDLGNMIILYHGDGYFTRYGHNRQNLVETRKFVHRGDVIANAGNTGISTAPHLHFEIWKDGKSIDPMIFFPEYLETDVSPQSDE